MISMKIERMPRWIWPIMIVVAFGGGLIVGVGRSRSRVTGQEVTNLQYQISTLQDELRGRDATVAALRQQLQVAASTQLPPPTLPTIPAPMKPIQDQGDPPSKTVTVSPTTATAPSLLKVDASPEHRKAAALDLFSQYQQQTGGLDRPGRRREGGVLLDKLLGLGEPAVDALIHVLQSSSDSRERRDAAILLGGLQNSRAIPVLQEIINNEEDVLTRRIAARGLSRLQLPDAIPAMEAVVANSDEDRFVRMNAAYGLAQLGNPQGIPVLTILYKEATQDGNGRFPIFELLTSLENAQVLPLMHEVATQEVEVGYRLRAIQFLTKNGDQQSLSLLQQIMDNPREQPSVREAAEQAWMAITKR